MITFACPHCGKPIKAPDEAAGKKGKCPQCGQAIQVPNAPARVREPPVVQSGAPGADNAVPPRIDTRPSPRVPTPIPPVAKTAAPDLIDTGASSPNPPEPTKKSNVDELAKKKLDGPIRWLVRKELKKLSELLAEGEEIVNLGQGTYDGKNGLVALGQLNGTGLIIGVVLGVS